MAYNCKIELNGNLGQDAKVLESNGKKFVALRVATTDNYPVEEGNKTVWKNSNTTLWHEVLIFNPHAIEIAEGFKKGDLVEIVGTLAYKAFKTEEGYNQNQASIIGRIARKVDLNKADPSSEEVEAMVDAADAKSKKK